jgi:hypothetical protein
MKRQIQTELYKYKTIKKTGKTILYTFVVFVATVFSLFLLCLPILQMKNVDAFLVGKYGIDSQNFVNICTMLFFAGECLLIFLLCLLTLDERINKEISLFIFFISLYYLIMFNFSIQSYFAITSSVINTLLIIICGCHLILNYNEYLNNKIEKLEKEQRELTNKNVDEIRLREMGQIKY